MVQGGVSWNVVQPRYPRARARGPGGGHGRGGEGAEGGGGAGAGGRGAGGRGAGAVGRGAAAAARGRADRPQGERAPLAGGGQGGRDGGQGRASQPCPSLPRANLEPRENTACLYTEDFQALPAEEEFVQWMEHKVLKDDRDVLNQVLEGFKVLCTEPRSKRMLMTMSTDAAVSECWLSPDDLLRRRFTSLWSDF